MLLRSYIKILSLLSILGVATVMIGSTQSKNIIFDLGGVLIKTDRLSSFWHLGPRNILQYPLVTQNSLQAKKRFFTFLEHIAPYNESQTPIYDADGTRLPQLMYNWIVGAQSSFEIIQYINAALQSQDYISRAPGISAAESNFFRAMAHMIFNPETFVKTRKVIHGGLKFVRTCKAHGNRVYVLSNWDRESFTLLCRKYPELFSLFDGIVISGDVGSAKPDTAIFNTFLATFNLNPSDCMFIDDQPENIRAARTVGIDAIPCPQKSTTFGSLKPDFKALRVRVL